MLRKLCSIFRFVMYLDFAYIFFNFYEPQQKIHINLFVMKYSGLATLDQGWQLLTVVRPGV